MPPKMLHHNRANAAEMDADHDADPYDLTLNAGLCRRCGQPCAWPDAVRVCGEALYPNNDGRSPNMPAARCTVRRYTEHSHHDHTPAQAIAAGLAEAWNPR